MPLRIRNPRKRQALGRGIRKMRSKYSGYKKVSPAVRRYVKKAISSNLENKVYIDYGFNQTLTTLSGTLASNTPGTIYLLPRPGQNVQQPGRIGNEIKIKSAVVKGRVNLLPYAALTNPLSTPVMVKMWVISFKTINSALIANCNTTNFFETGSASAAFQGNIGDLFFTLNKDLITVHKTKTFELGATYASTGGQVGTGGYFDNSKMTMPFYFSYGNKFRGTLKYNDAVTNVCENRNCWLITQVVYADGTSAAVNPAEIHYNNRIEYEDA